MSGGASNRATVRVLRDPAPSVRGLNLMGANDTTGCGSRKGSCCSLTCSLLRCHDKVVAPAARDDASERRLSGTFPDPSVPGVPFLHG